MFHNAPYRCAVWQRKLRSFVITILKPTTNSIFHNNINSQLYATITDFTDNYNHFDMFRAIISPILRSDRLFTACGDGDADCW